MPMPTFALCLGRRHCSCRLPECFLNVVKAWALGLGRCAQCVRILLEAGADPNVTNKSERTALSRASYNGTVDVVRLLPAAGAVVDAEDTSGNSTLRQCCAGHQCGPQQVECAKVLIEAGASPAHRNLDGETCIDRAKMGGARSEDLAAMLQVLGTTEGS